LPATSLGFSVFQRALATDLHVVKQKLKPQIVDLLRIFSFICSSIFRIFIWMHVQRQKLLN